MIEKEIIIIDEDGNELKMEIEFTYTDEATGKEYVFYFDPQNEDELFVAGYDEEGNLYEIETDEELDKMEKVLDKYYEEMDEE